MNHKNKNIYTTDFTTNQSLTLHPIQDAALVTDSLLIENVPPPTENLSTFKLRQQKQQVVAEIAKLEAQLRVAVDPDVDEGDPGIVTQVVTVALLHNARRKVEAIDHALAQAQSGSYGVCEVCHQSINPERLKIFPQATLCVPCKSKKEQISYRRAA